MCCPQVRNESIVPTTHGMHTVADVTHPRRLSISAQTIMTTQREDVAAGMPNVQRRLQTATRAGHTLRLAYHGSYPRIPVADMFPSASPIP